MGFIFCLVDCNNFYVSCERAFNPKLWGRPVIVLGNNDGCIIARSNEAKALGVPMGWPVFLVRKLIKDHNIIVMSANFPLYIDMRDRVREILGQFTPRLEKYSIDECFMDLSDIPAPELSAYGRQIKEMVERCTEIPVTVGIAETKSLTKVAVKVAKKTEVLKGVLDIYAKPRHRERALEVADVGDLWGIGAAYTRMLKANGISTAKQFRDAPDHWIRKQTTVMGARIQAELKATKCYPLDQLPPEKKMTGTAQGFGVLIESLDELRQAAAQAAEEEGLKLRNQKQCAKDMVVWVETNRFSKEPQYGEAREFTFPVATNNTMALTKYVCAAVEDMYKPGYRYKRVGINAITSEPADMVQGNFFVNYEDPRRPILMRTIDQLNEERGAGTIRMAATGPTGADRVLFQHQSPHYTTRISDLPIARVG